MSYSQLGMPKAIQMKSMTVAHSDTVIKCVYYGWMNSMAMAEGRKCNGYSRLVWLKVVSTPHIS
jgi:hypothetical protein